MSFDIITLENWAGGVFKASRSEGERGYSSYRSGELMLYCFAGHTACWKVACAAIESFESLALKARFVVNFCTFPTHPIM